MPLEKGRNEYIAQEGTTLPTASFCYTHRLLRRFERVRAHLPGLAETSFLAGARILENNTVTKRVRHFDMTQSQRRLM